MSLSILRISDGEQPQLLETASSFREGTRWQTQAGFTGLCVCVRVCVEDDCLHLILLAGFSSQEEAGDGDAAQVLWTGLQTVIDRERKGNFLSASVAASVR